MDTHPVHLPSLAALSTGMAEGLAQRAVFFGHQSVGANLLEGIATLDREHPAWSLRITDAAATRNTRGPVFAHARLGKNGDPESKMQDFAQHLASAPEPFDIAFFKFCYVDITSVTNVDRLFSDYERTMADLRERFPSTAFVHVTVPLTTIETGPKAWVKRLLGRPSTATHNRQRERYNHLLRMRYVGKEPVFDLALAESTMADGQTLTWVEHGTTFSSLVPAYTDDGGHLNALGQRRCAEQLLITLANAAARLTRR